MTAGLTGWAIGAALWIYYESIAHLPPFPSLADAGYLIFPIGVAFAMVLFPTGYSGHSRARFALDGVIVAGALFEISWVFVLRSIFESDGRVRSRWRLGSPIPFPTSRS